MSYDKTFPCILALIAGFVLGVVTTDHIAQAWVNRARTADMQFKAIADAERDRAMQDMSKTYNDLLNKANTEHQQHMHAAVEQYIKLLGMKDGKVYTNTFTNNLRGDEGKP